MTRSQTNSPIPDRRWYMFQNMGPAPTPRSGHTMTALKDKVYVLGGEPTNGMKSEDATMVYILDTSKSDFSINGGLISTY